LKIRHGAIADNFVVNVYAKIHYDRLRNGKVLVLWKFDNNNNPNKNNKNYVRGHWRPVPGQKRRQFTLNGICRMRGICGTRTKLRPETTLYTLGGAGRWKALQRYGPITSPYKLQWRLERNLETPRISSSSCKQESY